jgi:GT2 family glycosyltransferase
VNKSKPRVAIVLLSYNSLKLVREFLPKIIATTNHVEGVEIVVVDNASTDDLSPWMAENHRDIRVIKLEVNKGFTNGYCASLPQIEAENYVLISSDIEVTEGWLEPGLELLESDPKIAAVQPKVMSFDKREYFEYAGAAGGYIDHLGFPFCRGRLVDEVEKDEGQYDDVREIFWASGACLFINADAYHKSGGLDNDFFAHMEEIDLAWRLKLMGYKIMFQPKSKIFHMGGFVIQYGSPGKVFRNHRNNLIMLTKNLPAYQLFYKIPFRLLLDYAAMIKMIMDGNPKSSQAVFKAHWQYTMMLGKWLKKRKIVNSLRSKTPNHFGICPKSLVYQFFIRKVRKFPELKWDPAEKR